jgi:hypothetical protein|tara:strand:+ start:158 stop:316 length:159 start_codon:yes stop_codon:yes gene_type:complete
MNKTKHAINKLDEAYTCILSLVENEEDMETINLIVPILNKIDEMQNELEYIE